MTDSTLVKLNKCLKKDAIDEAYRGTMGHAEVAIATPFYTHHRYTRARRADIMLEMMTEEELNDLRTILSIGRLTKYGSGRLAPKKDDLAAWRSYLGMEKLTARESLKELRKMPTATIRENLNNYLEIKPMSQIRRNLIHLLSRN